MSPRCARRPTRFSALRYAPLSAGEDFLRQAQAGTGFQMGIDVV